MSLWVCLLSALLPLLLEAAFTGIKNPSGITKQPDLVDIFRNTLKVRMYSENQIMPPSLNQWTKLTMINFGTRAIHKQADRKLAGAF